MIFSSLEYPDSEEHQMHHPLLNKGCFGEERKCLSRQKKKKSHRPLSNELPVIYAPRSMQFTTDTRDVLHVVHWSSGQRQGYLLF